MRLLIVTLLMVVLVSCVPSPVPPSTPETVPAVVDMDSNASRTPLVGPPLLAYPANSQIENPFYGLHRDGSIIEQRYVTVNTSLFEDEHVTEIVFTEFDGTEHLITKKFMKRCGESPDDRSSDCGEKQYSWSGNVDEWGEIIITYRDDTLLGKISFPPSQHKQYWYSITIVPNTDVPGPHLLTKVNTTSLFDEGDDTPHWYSGWW